MTRDKERRARPPSGLTKAVPRYKEDLEAILELVAGDQPAMRCVRSNRMLMAYYGFRDAFSAGFESTVKCSNGIHGRFGLWGRDEEDKSSNYKELRNLMEMVEEEAAKNNLKDNEL
jgi:hypothetical protein